MDTFQNILFMGKGSEDISILECVTEKNNHLYSPFIPEMDLLNLLYFLTKFQGSKLLSNTCACFEINLIVHLILWIQQ